MTSTSAIGNDTPDFGGVYAWSLLSYPGCVQMVRTDLAALDRRNRAAARLTSCNDWIQSGPDPGSLFVGEFRSYVEEVASGRHAPAPVVRGKVTGWSYKSRLNMLRTVAQLDVSGRWGMLTLTLPGRWADIAPTPADCRAMFRAFTKRWTRQYGPTPMLWKFESQRRAAPHFHVGFAVPDASLGDVREWVSSAWHEIVCHGGDSCAPSTCGDLDALLHGARVDGDWSNMIDGKSLAAYFAKHGIWRDKDYQNESPGAVLRSAASLISIMSGVPLPAGFTDPNGGVGQKRTSDGAWSGVLELVEAWEHPGRWWGYIGMAKPLPLERTMSATEAEALRLIMRKVFTRRTTRLVASETDDGRTVVYRARRSLRSLRGTRGWYLLSNDPETMLTFYLQQAATLATIPPGVERARWLALHSNSPEWLAADGAATASQTTHIPVVRTPVTSPL